MGIEYRIDPSENVMYEVYKGAITVEELIAAINKEHNDPLYKQGMPTIADLTEASADWDYLQINQFRNFIKSIYPYPQKKVKWAVVAPPTAERAIVKVLDIMNEALGIDVEIQIFDNAQAALKWVK
jgi:hypothetical protein